MTASVRQIDAPSNHDTSPHIRQADVLLNKAIRALRLKKIFHWADPRFFHESAWFGWQSPHSYQPPRHYFDTTGDSQSARYKHLDVFHRYYIGLEDDQYLDPLNDRVRRLFVQTIDRIYDTDNDTSWRRTYVRNVSPRLLRLAWWSRAGLLMAKKGHATKQGTAWKSLQARTTSLTADQWAQLGLRWLPSCIGLLVLVGCHPQFNQHSLTSW